MDYLKVQGKTFLISGVANKKSVAFFTAKLLEEMGANLIFSVQHEKAQAFVEKTFPKSMSFLLDVEKDDEINAFAKKVEETGVKLSGFLHSIAFANLANPKPFHETTWEDYLQAERISCFSLTALSNALKNCFEVDASVVTVSISNTRATSYGYMGPIKASLDATVAYLAKSFSSFSSIRFNAVQSGPLKTSASAGIPGYIDNYLFAEQLTLRKKALATSEVADTITYLLSPRSSGINATGIVVDAGMNCNYFDETVVKQVSSNL